VLVVALALASVVAMVAASLADAVLVAANHAVVATN